MIKLILKVSAILIVAYVLFLIVRTIVQNVDYILAFFSVLIFLGGLIMLMLYDNVKLEKNERLFTKKQTNIQFKTFLSCVLTFPFLALSYYEDNTHYGFVNSTDYTGLISEPLLVVLALLPVNTVILRQIIVTSTKIMKLKGEI